MKTQILIAPGLGSSGEVHWQTLWEQEHPDLVRIEQKNWESPICHDWACQIERYVANFAHSPIVVVAHSLACIALVHWSQHTKQKIKGALLVAPADVHEDILSSEVKGFAPVPLNKLPFESIVVASSNDPYCTLKRSIHFARHWSSDFIHIGAKGHINAASQLGNWIDGKALLHQLAPDFDYLPDWSI